MNEQMTKNTEKSSYKSKDKKKKAVKSTASKNNKNMDKKKKKARTEKNINTGYKFRFFKFIIIFLLILICLILFLSSNFFNINEIKVNNNEHISDDEIISLSKIEKYSNIFSISKSECISRIKENSYIENVEIKCKLPDKLVINVNERHPNYMIQFADSYVYINNQGYMLEISNEKLQVPIILGFTTDLSNIRAGNRLDIDDLKKMDTIIKINEVANLNDVGNLITKIDVSDEKNYTLILENIGKKVFLGDLSNLNTKMLYLKSILEANNGVNGEVFLNMDLNTRNPYFRESIM